MRRRLSPARGLYAGAGIAVVVAVVIGVAVAPDLSDASTGPGAPPSTLSRIARQNDRAADEASARLRERSRREAEQADGLRAAEERGRAKAEAMLARIDAQAEPAAITQ